MKKVGIRNTVLGLIFVIAFTVGLTLFFNTNNTTTAYAATAPFNDPYSTNGKRIDG